MLLTWAQRLILALYTAMMAAILAVVLLCYADTAFYFKIHFLLPQAALLAIGAALLLAAAWLARRTLRRGAAGRAASRAFEFAPWFALFAFQALVCYHAYALPGMDANIVLSAAYDLATGDGYIVPEYYATYPNNAFLTIVYGGVMKLAALVLGHMGFERSVLIVILLQCALCCAAGWLTRRVALRMTGSVGFARLTAAVYALFAGISPWLTYPYSDCMGLIFPVLTLFLYQGRHEARREGLRWLLIALTALTGYLIKPQTLIVAMAIGLMEAAHALSSRAWRVGARHIAVLFAIVLLGAGPVFDAAVSLTPLEIDRGRSVGLLHYVTMGLNEETNGTYSADDVTQALSMEDAGERRDMLMEKAADRLRGMGVSGLLRHLKRKTLANYADGTFSWGGDCTGENYYREVIEEKDARLSPFFRDAIDFVDGRLYPYLKTYLHAVWLGLLFCSLLTPLAWRTLDAGGRETLCTALLAIIGLTLFEWIFEAQSRYLFTYIPLYLLGGLAGAAGCFKPPRSEGGSSRDPGELA